MNATKTKSGKWKCRVYVGRDENGNPVQKNVYGETKKEAELKASEFAISKPKINDMTVDEAISAYIRLREPVLSPSTIKGYLKIQRCSFLSIKYKKLSALTEIDCQNAINEEAETQSAKSVKNAWGLLSATIKQYYPYFKPRIVLPKKEKNLITLPNDNDIRALIDNCKDKRIKRAIMLGAYCGLRRSEISALTTDDINGNTLIIREAVVMDRNNEWQEKGTKTYSGTRIVEMPSVLQDELKGINGKLVDATPSAITSYFYKLCKKLNVHFRFHDLRHYYASTLHSLGIPDQYVMERGGWSNASTLKGIYQHPMHEIEKEISQKIADKFNNI